MNLFQFLGIILAAYLLARLAYWGYSSWAPPNEPFWIADEPTSVDDADIWPNHAPPKVCVYRSVDTPGNELDRKDENE